MSLKTLYFIITLLLLNASAQSQDKTSFHDLSGVTVEKEGKKNTYHPIAFSNICVLSTDNTVITKAVSIEDGSFHITLPDGKYTVLIENIGHKSVRLGIDLYQNDISLGNIVMETGEEIKASVITGQSLIHRHGKRITYDVSKDPDRYLINMTDMISRIPNVRMSSKNGKLAYGDLGFNNILINDERNGLINAQRQYTMEFIKAHYMKKIEVVLPDDDEYQNSEPILLITLDKKLPFGAASEQNIAATTVNEYNAGIDAVINSPIMGVGVGYSYSFDRVPTLTDLIDTDFSEGEIAKMASIQSNWTRSKAHNINTNLFKNYCNDKLIFNATLNTSYSNRESYSESYILAFGERESFLSGEKNIRKGQSTEPFRLNGSVRLSGYFKTKHNKQKHNWSVEYSYSDKQNEKNYEYSDYAQTGILAEKEHRLNSKLELKKIKFKHIIFNTTLNGGFYSRDYSSNTSYGIDNEYSSRYNGMDYSQNVAYCNLSCYGFAFQKIFFHTTINADYLSNNGYYLNNLTKSPLDYDSFNICPSIRVRYSHKGHSIRTLYSIKESRPKINALNPFEDRSNPSYIRTGNPDLKEQITHFTSLSFSPKLPAQWISLTLSGNYYYTKNLINSIVQAQNDGVMVQSYFNFGHANTYEGQADININFNKKLHSGTLFRYTNSYTRLPSGTRNNTRSFSIRQSLAWTPRFFELETHFFYDPRAISAQTAKVHMDPKLSVYLSRYFQKQHIGISIKADDLLRSGGSRETLLKDEGFTQRVLTESLGRTLQISVYWRFGAFSNSEKVNVSAYDME